jgi:hypothetical protein
MLPTRQRILDKHFIVKEFFAEYILGEQILHKIMRLKNYYNQTSITL